MEVLKERIRRRVVKQMRANLKEAENGKHDFYGKNAGESKQYLPKLRRSTTFQEMYEEAPYHDKTHVIEEVLKAMDGFLIFGQLLGPIQTIEVIRNVVRNAPDNRFPDNQDPEDREDREDRGGKKRKLGPEDREDESDREDREDESDA
jgi:hypothetical protein